MQANYVQRLRLTFSKTGPARFISHLDLARTLERSFNRARIPIAYTQGFNRRPRMSLAAALPLGFTSGCELADIWLAEAMDPEVLREQMNYRMAPGIDVSRIEIAALPAPSLQSITTAATYSVTLLDRVERLDIQQRIEQTLSMQSLIRQRRGRKGKAKEYDLRPLIIDLRLERAEEDPVAMHMALFLQAGKSGRPDEVLAALSLDPLAARIHRTKIILADPWDE